MAAAIPFLGANKEIILDPDNKENSFPVLAKGNEWISCWQLDKEEIQKVLETGRVWVTIRGRNHPYLNLTPDEPIEAD